MTFFLTERATWQSQFVKPTAVSRQGAVNHSMPIIPSVQRKLTIGRRDDTLEQEADHIAGQVMSFSTSSPISSTVMRVQCFAEQAGKQIHSAPASVYQALASSGIPLEPTLRQDMEHRFGRDFSLVRVHTDSVASQSANEVNARAYAVGHNIVFSAGKFMPDTYEGRHLIAHELAHVVQQTSMGPPKTTQFTQGKQNNLSLSIPAIRAIRPSIHRVIEVQPTGRGTASAFNRRQQLIKRLNRISAAIQYRFEGQRIVYDLISEATPTHFDRQLQGFIDRVEIAPMRFISRTGYAEGAAVLVDNFELGYVDLDDLLASDDFSFQMNLIHLLTERFRVLNYGRRIGTGFSDAEFDRAHRAGIVAEAAFLRNAIGDPTIRFIGENETPSGGSIFRFWSREGYRIFHLLSGGEVAGGHLFVRARDGRRLTIAELIAERAAAAVP